MNFDKESKSRIFFLFLVGGGGGAGRAGYVFIHSILLYCLKVSEKASGEALYLSFLVISSPRCLMGTK